jgi:hypothetical protein
VRPGLRTTVHVALAAVTALLLGGCGLTHLQDLNFRVDDRLHFTSPQNRATVHQPVTVSWTMRDFRIAPRGSEPPSDDAGYFAVFVDRAPIHPEQTMRAVAHGDRFCEQNPHCPDAAYLAQHQVYTTTKTTLRLPQIPNIVGSQEKLQVHSITVVLMNTAGQRIGESAWELDIRIPKVGFS